MNSNRNPLQLPEVLELVSQYIVDRKDLARCSLVNSLWHASFAHLFWAELRCAWCMESGLYKLMTLGSHKFDLVRTLNLNIKYIMGKPDIVVFPNLVTLALWNVDFPWHARFVADCFAKHQSVRILRISTCTWPKCLIPSSVVAQMDTMSSLSELHVSCATVDHSNARAFYQVCSRVKVLKLSYLTLRTTPKIVEAKEWRVRELTLFDVNTSHYNPSPEATELISSCLQLQSLDWQQQVEYDRYHRPSPTSPVFLQLATAGTWPLLSRLVLPRSGLPDRHWATILNPVKRVRVIDAKGTAFGALSFNALRPHLGTLEELDLSGTKVTSSIMVEILCSCSRLGVLRGVPVLAKDVISDERPWVCHMIEDLQLTVDLKPSPGPTTSDGLEMEGITVPVYAKISQLQQLRILSLGWLLPTGTSGCDLNKGFDQLKTLSLMEKLVALHQEIGQDNIMWMAEHWKNLKVLLNNESKRLSLMQDMRDDYMNYP
ncbi:hypothetical protein BGZ83_010409 [Gryganskiella cystojenkinii]|nr:hypothetical protein BGZ83_010409 [Gryganskiella cystojenkinii]